jgi:hypothetical protein
MKIRSAIVVALVATSCFVPSVQVVRAVTYGDPVSNPAAEFPEVVPVFIGSDSLCTGTLIQQQIVLTAAHCVYGVDQSISVGVNRITLVDGGSIQVDASWYHPRYDSISGQNDIALLHLVKPAGVGQLASLPKYSKNFTANKFLLLGWGDDQNGQLTNGLNRLSLVNQLSNSKKVFGNRFNQKTMIGAGRYFPDEAIYGGGCNGDSGGPLYKGEFGSGKVVVGITSFGRTGCNTKAPTIFTKVSFYIPELIAGIQIVNAKSDANRSENANTKPKANNRTLPNTVPKSNSQSPSTTTPRVSTSISISSTKMYEWKFGSRIGSPYIDSRVSIFGTTIERICISVTTDGNEYFGWTNYYSHWVKIDENCLSYKGQFFEGVPIRFDLTDPPGIQGWRVVISAFSSSGQSTTEQLAFSR